MACATRWRMYFLPSIGSETDASENLKRHVISLLQHYGYYDIEEISREFVSLTIVDKLVGGRN